MGHLLELRETINGLSCPNPPKWLELPQEEFDALLDEYRQATDSPVWTGALLFKGVFIVRRPNPLPMTEKGASHE